MFGSEQWMYSSGGASLYDTQIDGSLRFDGSSYLTRTPSSTTNRRTWTWSGWVKRNKTGVEQFLFGAGSSSGGYDAFYFSTSDQLQCLGVSGGAYLNIVTPSKFRDPSAWYHIVIRVDTTQGTITNRFRLYVNGELATVTRNADLGLNRDMYVNLAQTHRLGARSFDANFKSQMYLAEVNFIDGQSLDPTSFGETKSGVWIPKEYSGSYGTNGYHLQFAGNANDSAGSNNWSATSISSHDYVPDSPTNNFATLNVLGGSNLLDNSTFSQGNLLHGTTDAYDTALATMGVKTGKWYAEVRMGSTGSQMVGVRQTNALYDKSTFLGGAGGQTSFYRVGRIYTNGSYTTVTAATSGDVIQIALDADNGYVWYGRNNTWYGTVDTSTGRVALNKASHGDEFFIGSGYRDNRTWNFGQDSTFAGATTAGGNSDDNGYGDFKYSVPSGYLALCTANLPVAEGVDPAFDNSPQDHFAATIWTGNGSTSRAISTGHDTDFVWLKQRNVARQPHVYDAVRGATKLLYSSLTNAEQTLSNGVIGFGTDGFTVGNELGVNASGGTYVAWTWKANGSGVSNSDGTLSSTVSANTDSGFSIVKWTGNGAARTIGHGLDQKPELIILRNTSDVEKGEVMYDNTAPTYSMLLFAGGDGSAAGRLSNYFTSVSDTTFGVGAYNRSNGSGDAMIAYCFHSVEGFSKFGTYEGNLSNDGPFVYTGFRPALVVVKDVDSAKDWRVHDDKRGPYNAIQTALEWNTADTEITGTDRIDFVSNGFKIRNNSNGWNATETYIYIAFAENPFKYANAR